MATVAVFIALGGSSYAALRVTGRNVATDALTGADIKNPTGKNNSLAGTEVKNKSLTQEDFTGRRLGRDSLGGLGVSAGIPLNYQPKQRATPDPDARPARRHPTGKARHLEPGAAPGASAPSPPMNRAAGVPTAATTAAVPVTMPSRELQKAQSQGPAVVLRHCHGPR
jgi:hypothetical protein